MYHSALQSKTALCKAEQRFTKQGYCSYVYHFDCLGVVATH